MTRTVITLRARSCSSQPRPGDLMAAATGTGVYRIETVTTLRQAGEKPGTHRYRLTCTRLAPSEVPHGVEIHPWRRGPRAAPDGPARRCDATGGCQSPDASTR
jgi:hypothetical protein